MANQARYWSAEEYEGEEEQQQEEGRSQSQTPQSSDPPPTREQQQAPSQTPQTQSQTPTHQPTQPQAANVYMQVLQNVLAQSQRTQQQQTSEHAAADGSYGPYVDDDHLEEVIAQLMLQPSTGRSGPPPAAPFHVNDLDEIIVDSRNKDKIGKCAVCKDEFSLHSEAIKLPCKHYFHHDCIYPWLGMHNTCPLCRHELPTLDIDYEESRAERQPGGKKEHNSDPFPEYMYM